MHNMSVGLLVCICVLAHAWAPKIVGEPRAQSAVGIFFNVVAFIVVLLALLKY